MHHHQPHVHLLALGTIPQMAQQVALHVRTSPQTRTIPARAAVQIRVAGHVTAVITTKEAPAYQIPRHVRATCRGHSMAT